MEPRPHERGNWVRMGVLGEHPRLQWSHVLTNVETRCRDPHATRRDLVLQWSHVLTNVETLSF